MCTKVTIFCVAFLVLNHSANSQRSSGRIDWNELKKGVVNHSYVFYEIRKLNNASLADTVSTKTIQFKSDSVFVISGGVILSGVWKNAQMDFYVIDSIGIRIDYDFKAGSGDFHICFSVENNRRFTECYRKVK